MPEHKADPTRRALLQRIAEEYETLQPFWREGYYERGPGALVLYQRHTAVGDLRSVAEFWTLGELRSYLRSLGCYDEFTYAWFHSVRDIDAFPAFVVGPDHEMSRMKLSFYRIHKPAVEKSRRNS
jgi:hypothetical protein